MESVVDWPRQRASVIRDAVGVGLAVGALGISFGALSAVFGLSLVETSALSLLMFSGASQFAFIGVIGAGGNPLAGAAVAALLGSRNALYGLNLSALLGVHGPRRALAAHLVLDESSAMAIGRRDDRSARLAFWATGASVFVLWNLATLFGAWGAAALPDPSALGLDVASPAAFIALLAPRVRSRGPWVVALAAGAVALAAVPFVPIGTPALVAAVGIALVIGLLPEVAD
ncbi:AzlC family ABC transporter permease [Kitasatospora sp. GP82]|uniref:AzlC family ABC transporter permease n=1 Tax=Kitasatospora sp. GP82 TaxID=3035089 RepID=UPI002473FE52|nr:AzlC family ABC transporter permease [Kitasatospora sp. GP82]MDH6125384.1 putative branched-subunit amino acid permease [Kitasatospora sp. GP82]